MIRARAPLRISFGGGGTDIAPYYQEFGGGVLSSTINRYAYVTLLPENDIIKIKSLDYGSEICIHKNQDIVLDGQFDIAKVVLKYFLNRIGRHFGCSIYLHNDAPPGSGLGSSSAIVVALVKAVSHYLNILIEPYEMAELAFFLEREEAKIKGGKQDQYATVFGGFNFIEFFDKQTIVHPLRLRDKTIFELEYNLVFAYVGGNHEKTGLIDKQISSYNQKKITTINALHNIKSIAVQMKESLLLDNLTNLADTLDIAWQEKKKVSEGISNDRIDQIYETAKTAGALGGKITGAGGGGFMFFLCDLHEKFFVEEALKAIDVSIVNISFTNRGVESWNI